MARRPQKRSGRRRGMALLLAVVSIAVLTAVATDFAYNQRVDTELAVHQRDALQAYYLAQSGIGLSRMLLRFQGQLDQIKLPNIGGLLGQLTGGAQSGAPNPLGNFMPSHLNIQLWRAAKVDCHLLQGLSQDAIGDDAPFQEEPADGAPTDGDSSGSESKGAPPRFGHFKGCFDAQISDEGEKLNLNQLDAPGITGRAAATRMLGLLSDKRFQFLFDEPSSNGVRTTPQDLVIAIKDWVDADNTESALNLEGEGEPFLPGFADEAASYDDFDPRYKPKNAPFDTLDELYMVPGITDRVMAAFQDRLTVYTDVNAPLDINSDDPMMLEMAVLSVLPDPAHPDPRVLNPVFMAELIQEIRTARAFSFLGMSVGDFVNLVKAAGLQVNPSIASNATNNRWITDKSNTFRIVSTGQVNGVSRKLTAVVRIDGGIGKILYWRED